jgi:hypothetical protein
MANTHCKLCLYAKEVTSDEPCEFNIISYIKDIKEISTLDDYFYIKNYKCSYGFSKDKYLNEKNELDSIDLKQHIIQEAKISYYLVVDMRSLNNEQITTCVDYINNLDIKPKFLSLIVRTSTNILEKIDIFNKTVAKEIKWKAHAFIEDVTFNSCLNIAAETNVADSNCQFLMAIDGGKENNLINDMVNHCHYMFKVLQDNVHIIMKSPDDLNGIFIPVTIYKSMINAIGGDLIKALSMIPNIIIKNYEIEKSI